MSRLKTLLQQFLSPPFSASKLPEIIDWPTLVKMQKNALGEFQEQMIDEQMAKVLPGILAPITNWLILVDMRNNAPAGSRAEQIIDNHMAWVLPAVLGEISHWDMFVEILDNILPDSAHEQFVVHRMEEFLRYKLPKISIWEVLLHMHETAPLGTLPERLIEQRMAEMVGEIDLATGIPEWFIGYLGDPGTIPFHLARHVSFKAHELLTQL